MEILKNNLRLIHDVLIPTYVFVLFAAAVKVLIHVDVFIAAGVIAQLVRARCLRQLCEELVYLVNLHVFRQTLLLIVELLVFVKILVIVKIIVIVVTVQITVKLVVKFLLVVARFALLV